MNQIIAVLFDLDGVLVEACDWHYEALNAALIDCGYDPIDRDSHLTTFNGLPTHVKLKMLNIPDEVAVRVNQRKQQRTLDVIRERSVVMPEKVELHRYLKSHGVKIACVTNSIRETASAMLNATGQMEYMDLLISNQEVKNNKPHPDCYNHAIELLKVNPIGCLCVEDSPKGIDAARASRAKYLWTVKDSSEVILNNYRNFVDRLLR